MQAKIGIIVLIALWSVSTLSTPMTKKACMRFYGLSLGLGAKHAKVLLDQNRHQEAAWMLVRMGETSQHKELMAQLEQSLQNSEISHFEKLNIPSHEGLTSEIYLVHFKDGLRAIFKPHSRFWTEKEQSSAFLANPYAEKVASDFSEVLEMHVVPRTVIRTIHGMEGSLHAFIDFNVHEGYTWAEMQKISLRSWYYETVYSFADRQSNVIKLFQYLVYNMDGTGDSMGGNSGNVKKWLSIPRLDPKTLPGEASGKVALDFGASFQEEGIARGRHRPYNMASKNDFSLKGTKSFYENLTTKLTEEKIRELMKDYFSNTAIEQVISRRAKILDSMEKRIDELTELSDPVR